MLLFIIFVKSYLILCDPMDCSVPGLPVLHCLPEIAQIHVHRVCDAISFSATFPSYFFIRH